MAYLNSDNISVFPCANRDAKYIASKLTTERNLTNIINSIVTTDGFVLHYVTDGHIQFVLDGYYFDLNTQDAAITGSTATNIYASIKLGGTDPYLELQNIDGAQAQDTTLDGTKGFLGLQLTDTKPTDSGYTSLLILTRATTSGAWQVPETSKIRLVSGTGNITVKIDDGEL